MRQLINYICSYFCKHEWELMDKSIKVNRLNEKIGTKWTYRCKKCGYFYTYENCKQNHAFIDTEIEKGR